MLRDWLFILLVIIVSLPTVAQEMERESMRIPLYSKSDSLLFGNAVLHLGKPKNNNTDLSKFIIPENISDFTTHYVELNESQAVYSRMVRNQLTQRDSIDHDLNELQKFAISHNRPLKSITYFIHASQGDSILFIADTDNDLDFTDEEVDVFRYDALPKNRVIADISKMPKKKLRYEYYLKDQDEVIQREYDIRLFLSPNRYKEVSYSTKPKLQVVVKSEEGRVGAFSLGGEDYKVLVSPYLAFFDNYKKINLKVLNTKDSIPLMSTVSKKRLREEDIISFGDELYQILSPTVFGTELVLKKVLPNEVIYGDKPKQYIRDFEAVTIDEEFYKLSDHRGKYVLLDFWGMWCRPCLESLPELRRIRETYKDLQITSVALISPQETIQELKSFVEKVGLEWTHIADDSRSKESSIVKLRIEAYPTYILVDPEGKILFRSLESRNRESRLNQILNGIFNSTD